MNTIAFIRAFEIEHAEMPQLARYAKLRAALYEKGICWTDSIHGQFTTHDNFRVVLYLKNFSNGIDFANPLVSECNGLVLECVKGKWQALVVPVPNCTQNKISINQVDKFYKQGKYRVYEMLDATMINLYFYQGEWRISTGKGYDITDFEFVSGRSYWEMFISIAEEKYSRFNIEQLNINFCYTIAMRSSEFQLFDETKHIVRSNALGNDYLKLIKVSNPNTNVEVELAQANVAIPAYLPIEVKNANSVSVLANYAKNAYVKYAKGFETNNFKFKPLYGYILRSTSESVARPYRNVMFVSSLFTAIKQGLYMRPQASIEELVAYMFVNRRHKNQFVILFDQYSSLFARIEDTMRALSMEVVAQINKPELAPTTQTVASKIAQQFWHSNSTYHTSESNLESLVYDYIHSANYVDDLVRIMKAQA